MNDRRESSTIDEEADLAAKLVRLAGMILLLRGTAGACAGLVAGAVLLAETDPLRWWMLAPFLGGVWMASLSLPVMRGNRVARAMLVLCGLSSLGVAWAGSAGLLA